MSDGVRLLCGGVLAVVVPALVLHFGAPDERLVGGLTAAPFAWPRVLVGHLLTALPLGFVVARWVRALPALKDANPALLPLLGCAAPLAGLYLGGIAGEAAAGGDLGFVPLLVLRAALALGLVLPWCVWASEPPQGAAVRPGLLFGLGAGFALLPCGLYADSVIAAKHAQAADLLQRERLVRADAVLTGLVELGSERPFEKRSAADARRDIAKRLPALRKAADRPALTNPGPQQRLERAVLMIQLDRLAEAAEQLEPLAGDDTVALLLATVYRDQERWADSDALYARVLDARLPRAATDPPALDLCQTAIEGLAFNARADGRPADAERVLLRGLEALPGRAGWFHLQLGRHYHDGGRDGLALDHLRKVAERDPARAAEANAVIDAIRLSTPSCLVAR